MKVVLFVQPLYFLIVLVNLIKFKIS